MRSILYELCRPYALTATDFLASRTVRDLIYGKNQCGLSLGGPIATDRITG